MERDQRSWHSRSHDYTQNEKKDFCLKTQGSVKSKAKKEGAVRVGNRAVAYSALYHNSFILGHSCSRNVAWDICRRRESDIRARGQTNPIHPGPIRTDLVEWIDPLLYALLLSELFPTRTRRTSFDYSWDIVETFFYGWEWGVKRPMQQRTTEST